MLHTGMPLGSIADLDILTFNALLSSVIRVSTNQKIEHGWTAMIAAQGSEKSMKDWTKALTKAANPEKAKKTNDIKAFLSDLKGKRSI